MSATEGRTPTAPEIIRDFELVLDDRLREERRRRRSAERLGRLSLVLALAGVVASALIGYTLYDRRGPGIASGVVRTGELRLVDSDGRVRGRWQVLPGGATRLGFLDPNGVERMRFSLLENGAQGISLTDAKGEGRVVLSLEGDGSRLTLADGAGRPRAILGLSPQQDVTLLFADDAGNPRVAIGLEQSGRAVFTLPGEPAAAPAPADTAGTS